MNLTDPDERSANTGEYLLGTLDDAERAEFETALGRDGALRAELAGWQDRLFGLHRHAAPADPSNGLWQRIETRMPGSPFTRAAGAPASSATGLRHRLGLWQALAGAAVAAAVVLAVRPALGPVVDEGRPHYLAVLQSPSNEPADWVVDVRSGGALRLVHLGARPTVVPAGHSLQFWTKPVGAAGPTSMGLLTDDAPLQMPASRLPTLGEQQLFEITLEPAGGSRVGKPTGPVLYVGRAVQAPG